MDFEGGMAPHSDVPHTPGGARDQVPRPGHDEEVVSPGYVLVQSVQHTSDAQMDHSSFGCCVKLS